MPEKQPSVQHNALTLGKGTLASRLLGFVRDAIIAALLGGGWMADALLLAFRLPNFARSLLAEGAFAYNLVPAYRNLKQLDPVRAWAFLRSVTIALFCLFGVVTVAGALFSDQATLLFAPGFGDMPDVLDMASNFLGLCLLSLPLVAGAAVSAAALMAEGKFHRPAYASAIFNIVILLSALTALFLYGAGDERVPYILCAGVIAAGVVQWVYQTVPLSRLGFSLFGPVDLKDPLLRRSLRSLPGSVFGVGGHQVNILLATLLASFLAEGSISALYFAERLIGFPLGIIAASIGLASLSELSTLALAINEGGDGTDETRKAFTDHVHKAFRITFFFALPAAAGTACLALPLTAVIFGYGEFDHAALLRTSGALLAYVIGLPALSVIRPLLAALGALGDTRASMRGALAGGSATLLFGAASLLFDAAWGPALAVSLAAWVNAAFLVRALVSHGYSPLPRISWMLKICVSCGIMAACVLLAASLVTANPAKVLAVPLGVLVYFAVAFCLRVEETVFGVRIARNILKKK